MPSATLRIARPTNDLQKLKEFYTKALGMRIIGSFENHAGFDGVMLGLPDCTWHLEFTHQHGVSVDPAPSTEHLLVFYLPANEEWDATVKKVEGAGGVRVQSENPYWDAKGVTFEDPDGYRLVLQNASWP
ncbi:related to glyoxalase family protein [Phialocephala subalpina]|uniref:Related to glyoxalase family protein n=1 Tax=Phialocephala subalpina TaxID=576137 RepID=A0A1L7XDB7_9HELO|nr:related to glyoxalase family protein [Phialocephala subalpina]